MGCAKSVPVAPKRPNGNLAAVNNANLQLPTVGADRSNTIRAPTSQYGAYLAPAAGPLRFFNQVKHRLDRDYILLIDCSGSMQGTRWTEAEAAVTHLANAVCEFDPDGIDIVFFSSGVQVHHNITGAETVRNLFRQQRPRGSTNLAAGLQACFARHFAGHCEGSTILCITDGCPDDPNAVEQTIIHAANMIGADVELSVSFIQIGDDVTATRYLKRLDDDLVCKFDIVDTMPAEEMKGISFNELIQRSIDD